MPSSKGHTIECLQVLLFSRVSMVVLFERYHGRDECSIVCYQWAGYFNSCDVMRSARRLCTISYDEMCAN